MRERQRYELEFEKAETTSSPVVSAATTRHAADEADKDMSRRSGFLGTGLHAAVLVAIFAVSTAAFLFWGGPLWSVRPGTSHVARIGGSYLIVVPLVAAALVLARRWSLQHLLGSVAAIWSAKLVITATSYTFVAPGSVTEYAPARPWESKGAAPSEGPSAPKHAAARRDEIASVSGRVLEGDVPVTDAVVVAGDFASAGPPAAPTEIALAIEQSRYEKPIYLVHTGDRLVVKNRDGVLHTIRFLHEKTAVANVPVPPGPPHPVAVPLPGAYEMSCENHASERALLVVVDHHSAAVTDSEGRFELRGLPAGESELLVIRPQREPVRRTIRLAHDEASALSIELK